MTTAAQVRKLVRPLMERHPDFALVGRMIVVPPVGHVLRAIYIDRTGEAAVFSPKWLVMHLFAPARGVHLSLGGEIYPRHSDLWWIADAAAPEALVATVEAAALPKLLPLGELEAYVGHKASVPYHGHQKRPLEKVIIDVALGRLDDARTICREVIAPLNVETFGQYEEDKARLRRAKEICRLLAGDDRAGLAALLHEWEATTVRNLKIEHLWEKTPFPLEDDRAS